MIACGSVSDSKKKEYVPESTGSPYEMVIVCDNDLWETSVGDSVKNIFQGLEPMLNQEEPKFGILRKRAFGFKGVFTRHRNVLMLKIDTTLSDDNQMMYGVNYDQWAKPQIVISLKAKNDKQMAKLFELKKADILFAFEEAEQFRFVTRLRKYSSAKMDSLLRNDFGLSLSLPKNYVVRNLEKPNFVWLSYEMPTSSQGILVYTYPYHGEKLTEAFLMNKRNEFVKRVPGQLPNTHMQNSELIVPIFQDIDINNRKWLKISGFWGLKGDFMGGPFRNYSTIDTSANRVISIDCYVYSPDYNKGQRNYIKQLDAVVRTFKLD